jgi:glycosyltransferase involved in cell wall biosynthesis
MKISVVIITKNASKTISACLNSVAWADEIIVIDDYSDDDTIKIAKSRGAIVFKRELNNDFSSQRNFGIKKTKNNWVLFLDADEIIPTSLSKEIVRRLKFAPPNISGFYFFRKDYFINHWLNHGETAGVKLLRLAKKNYGLWQGKVHETWQIKGDTEQFKKPILHYPHKDLATLYRKINHYTDIRAEELKEKNITTNLFEIIFYPLAKFIQNYVFKKGYKDGTAGAVFALSMSFHSFLVRAKLWQITNS